MINWKPIRTAPNDKEILVGAWVNDEWFCCISSHCYDSCSLDEKPYWYWSIDYDSRGITDGEGPSHWAELAPPAKEASL